MDENTLQNIRERVDAKLRYAQVHLDELRELKSLDGSDFDRAHQESFLYHLLGAKDAFLLELNAYYRTGLSMEGLTAGKLRNALKEQGKESFELSELFQLENQESCWLFQAKEMRDYSTHISNIPRAYFLGGERDQEVHLKNPNTGQQIERHFVEEFADWLTNMKGLLKRLRSTTIENTLIRK